MALLGFKKRFAPKVRGGKKRQTIRNFRKYPIRVGETLYLYTALRTKYSEKLREAKCKSVDVITISFNTGSISYGSEILTKDHELDSFAKKDGFNDWNDMRDFWIQEHGVKKGNRKVILLPYTGTLIQW
jgi:hypothetical protein